MSAASSLMRSIGNGGEHSGFIAMLISFIGLSSAATRFEDIAPHLRHYSAPAHFADKSLVAGVSLIITFFVLFAFVFAIHFSSRGLSCGRTAECVLFADLPVSAHSPMIL